MMKMSTSVKLGGGTNYLLINNNVPSNHKTELNTRSNSINKNTIVFRVF